MSWEPVTHCRVCNDAFDVYRAPDERVCDACADQEPAAVLLGALKEMLAISIEAPGISRARFERAYRAAEDAIAVTIEDQKLSPKQQERAEHLRRAMKRMGHAQ